MGTQDRTFTNTGLSADIADKGTEVTITAKTDIADSKVVMTVNGVEQSYAVDLTKLNAFYFVGELGVVVYYSGVGFGGSGIDCKNGYYVYSQPIKSGDRSIDLDGDGLTIAFKQETGREYWTITASGYDPKGTSTSDFIASTWIAYPSVTGAYVMQSDVKDELAGAELPGELEGAWGVDGSRFIWVGFDRTETADTSSIMIFSGNPYSPSTIQGALFVGSTQAWIKHVDSVEVIEEVPGAKKFGGVNLEISYVDYSGGVFVAPKSVFVPGTADQAVISMVNMIPLLLMVGLVVGVVGAYRMRGEAQR